jgi:ribosomal protein S18 acetylase RimI-like enzyme
MAILIEIHKPHIERVPNTPEKIDSLAQMTYDQLADTEYPIQHMSYIADVAVVVSHQRKGVGHKLMEAMLADMPTEVEFKSRDGKHIARGPAKHWLFATAAGRGLYEKFGFKVIAKIIDPKARVECPEVILHHTA